MSEEVVEVDEAAGDDDDDDACLMDLKELDHLLSELASTRPDVQTPSTRNAQLKCVVEALTDPEAHPQRQRLAEIGKGMSLYRLFYFVMHFGSFTSHSCYSHPTLYPTLFFQTWNALRCTLHTV